VVNLKFVNIESIHKLREINKIKKKKNKSCIPPLHIAEPFQ